MYNSPNEKGGINFNVDPFRTPILYVDSVHIRSNENGIVLDIAQQIVGSNQFAVVVST